MNGIEVCSGGPEDGARDVEVLRDEGCCDGAGEDVAELSIARSRLWVAMMEKAKSKDTI